MLAADYVRQFKNMNLLIVGDVMLDVYEEAEIIKTNEGYSPAYRMRKQTYYPGGAANVAVIVRALGAYPTLIGVTGDDDSARQLVNALHRYSVSSENLICEAGRGTPTKTRVSVDGVARYRRDWEFIHAYKPSTVLALGARLAQHHNAPALLLSDYDKGLFRSPGVIPLAMDTSMLRVLDPKRSWAPFAGVQYATPNEKEAGKFAGVQQAMRELPGALIVETRGACGALIHREGSSEPIETVRASEVDAVGAGDAFAAGFTLALAAGSDVSQATIVGQGVARWWVLHERGAVLNLSEVENQIQVVEDVQ